MKSQKNAFLISRWLIAAIVIILATLPFFASSGREKKIYVNGNAGRTQDGSVSRPYKTIEKAMEHADEDTEIHVANGTYRENVVIRKGVELYGENKDKTVIKAADDGKPAVFMFHKSKINKFTVREGKDGVRVDDGARVSIIKCSIRDNEDDGIHVEDGDTGKKSIVSISENEIQKNEGAGIYSERHRLSIVDNEIEENDKDGIDLAKGSIAWVAGNEIRHNKKSGLKLRIDKSEIWTKSNSVTSNGREGIEISWSGDAGRIDISKSKIRNNDRWGVARVQRHPIAGAAARWKNYLTFDNRNEFFSNKDGSVSPFVLAK